MDVVDKMLLARFGEKASKVSVKFKKTVKTAEYETEVIEVENTLDVEEELTGMERLAIMEILKCQSEYMVYIDLLEKGIVTRDEYMIMREQLSVKIQTIIARGKQLGIDLHKYIDIDMEV